MITTNQAGERSFSYCRDASTARELYANPEEAGFKELNEFDALFMSAISLAIMPQTVHDRLFDWWNLFRGMGGKCVFGRNYRPALWTNKDIAKTK